MLILARGEFAGSVSLAIDDIGLGCELFGDKDKATETSLTDVESAGVIVVVTIGSISVSLSMNPSLASV